MTLVGLVHLGAGRDALLVLAGFGAGLFNGIAGGGTLVAFPALLAVGYPALTANVTSTVGIWPGYLGGVAGFRREILDQHDRFAALAPVTVVGALARCRPPPDHPVVGLHPARPVARPLRDGALRPRPAPHPLARRGARRRGGTRSRWGPACSSPPSTAATSAPRWG